MLIRGVIGSWAVQIVYIVAGFVVPRFISDQVGRDRLGVWDFGWTFVSYLTLVQAGMRSSIARFAARYAGQEAWASFNSFLKTGFLAFSACSALALVVTVGTVLLLPSLFGESLADHMQEARWVIFIFGLAVCAQFPQAVFGGVIAGCRRYDLLNAITAGGYLLQVTGIIACLLLRENLALAAVAVLAGDVVMWIAKSIAAHGLCPHLKLRGATAGKTHLLDLLVFGGKTQLSKLASIIAYQTSSVLVVGYLGPAALALYARPRSLVMNIQIIVRRLAMVLEPSASLFQVQGKQEQLKRLYLEGTRFAAYTVLPMVVVLTLMADPIMTLWMGAEYRNSTLMAILAVGHVPPLIQRVTFSVALGMGKHGRVAVMDLVASAVTVALTLLLVGGLGWGITGAALALVAPLFLINVFLIPIYGCALAGVSLVEYLRRSLMGPIACCVPFASILLCARWLLSDSEAVNLLAGLAVGGVWLAGWYWIYVLPDSLKAGVSRVLQSIVKLPGRVSSG